MLKSVTSLGLFCVLLVTLCAHCPAAETSHCLGANGPQSVPAKITEKPIALRSGIALVHENVSTHSPAAQRYYDQGLAFLYAYDWIDAARSFQQALRHDSQLAMAHLGLSYAASGLGQDGSAGEEAAIAGKFVLNASGREALRVSLRLRQLESMHAEERGESGSSYLTALTRALAEYPNDIHLLLLRGNAAEGTAFGRGQQGKAESIAYYEKVLQLDPSNPAAHHYLIHAWELSNNTNQAIAHARIFAEGSSSLPHAHHMYGHELLRAGKTNAAVVQFEWADSLENKEWIENPGARGYDWHYRHNLNLLAAAYRLAGKPGKAEVVLQKLAILPGRSELDEYYQAQFAAMELENGKNSEALAAVRNYLKPRTEVGMALQHAIRGSALLRTGNPGAAADELAFARKKLDLADPGWRPFLLPWINLLDGELGIRNSPAPLAERRLMIQIRELEPASGTDAWSDALFHFEHLGKIALEHRLWESARLCADRLNKLAPTYAGGQRLLTEIQEMQREARKRDH